MKKTLLLSLALLTATGIFAQSTIEIGGIIYTLNPSDSTATAMGILFPFLVAAIFKSAQGSSTVAITTTAGLIAPLLPALGLVSPVEVSLAVLSIGAGAMTVSHANDSYFWVVSRFGGLTVEDGYRAHTMATLVLGLSSIAGIFLISLVI